MKSPTFCFWLLSCLLATLAHAMEPQASPAGPHVYRHQTVDNINLENKHALQYDYSGSVLSNPNMKNTLVTESNFRKSRINNGMWQNSMIQQCNWQNSQIADSDFSCSAVEGTHRHKINFEKPIISNTNMQNMAFTRVNMQKVRFNQGTDLSYASFINVNMRGAILDGVMLNSSVFRNVDLRGARFKNVDFRGAKFEKVRLGGAKIWDEKSQKYRPMHHVELLGRGASYAGFYAAVQMLMYQRKLKKEAQD